MKKSNACHYNFFIPNDLLLEVLQFLDYNYLLDAKYVNRQWFQLIQSCANILPKYTLKTVDGIIIEESNYVVVHYNFFDRPRKIHYEKAAELCWNPHTICIKKLVIWGLKHVATLKKLSEYARSLHKCDENVEIEYILIVPSFFEVSLREKCYFLFGDASIIECFNEKIQQDLGRTLNRH